MARYADPSRCPDCLTLLPAQPVACPHCALPLATAAAAPLSAQLFETLGRADRVLEEMRALRVATPTPTATSATPDTSSLHPAPFPVPAPPAGGFTAGQTPFPQATGAPARQGVKGATVPRILLGLGALCLLAFAVIFMAVAWALMPVGLRVLVLLALTTLAGTTSWQLSRRRLTTAAEALGVVTAGMVPVVVGGARSAGWLGDLPFDGLVSVSALLVGGLGLAGAWATLRAHGRALLTGQLAAPAGTLLAGAAATTWTGWSALSLTLTVGLLLGLVLLADRTPGTEVLRYASTGAAALAWLGLLVVGLGRTLSPTHPSWSHLLDGVAWPTLATAGVLLPALTLGSGAGARTLRTWLVGGGVLLVGLAPASTVLDEGQDAVALLGLGVVAVGAVCLAVLPRPWQPVPAVPTVVGVLAALPGVLVLAGAGLVSLLGTAEPFSRSAGVHLAPQEVPWSWWILPLGVAVLTAASAVALHRTGLLRPTAVVAAVLVLLATVPLTVALHPLPVWTALLALLPLVACAAWWAPRHPVSAAVAVGGAVVLLGTAAPSEVLSLVVVTAMTSALAVLHLRPGTVGAGAAGLLPLGLAGTGLLGASVAGVDQVWWALPVLVVVGVLVVLRASAPLHVGAAVAAAGATVVAVDAADRPLTWLAVHLTVAAVPVAVHGIVTRRREAGWVAGGLLLVATWLRLVDTRVEVVEAYTLPAAVVLLVVGLRAMLRDRALPSRAALGTGLVLATVPSLLRLLVVGDLGLRAALLALACLALVLAGTALRWSAPLVVGAAVGAVLVIRLAAPYAALLPPWLLIGLAGAVLTVVGTTWEAQLRRVQAGGAALARLR